MNCAKQPATDLEKAIASVVGAATVAVFFWVILTQFDSVPVALSASLIFAFCTSMWSTATRALWQHGPLVLMLSIAMLLLARTRRRPDLVQYVGVPLALGYVMRPTASLPIAVISVYVLIYHRAWLARYLAGAALVAIPWLVYNLSIYHALLPDYYVGGAVAQFSPQSQLWDGLLGTLFSPSRGLFIYSPVLLFALSGFALALRDPAQRPLHIGYGVIVAVHTTIMAATAIWWAGHAFGPRYLTDVIPFLVYFTAFNLRLPARFRLAHAICRLGRHRNSRRRQCIGERPRRIAAEYVDLERGPGRYRLSSGAPVGLERSAIRPHQGDTAALISGSNQMEHVVPLHIEKLPEGGYLATSDAVQGLVAQGHTIAETLEIARDVAKKLIEAQSGQNAAPWRRRAGVDRRNPRHVLRCPP